MASTDSSSEAEKRAQEANKLIDKGDFSAASKLLREASNIDEANSTVKAAWERLQAEGEGPALSGLCKKFVDTKNEDDGEAIMDYLTSHQSISPANLGEAMKVLLQYDGDIDIADEVTGELLKRPGTGEVLAQGLKDSPTVTCNTIFERGDDSMNGQTDLLLDPKRWQSEADRIAAERDVFQLALAQLMKAGQDFPERAMQALSRLLGAEAKNLNGLIDADGFDVILSNLDIRLPPKLRGQATLACVKLLELSPDTAKMLISQFVVQRIERPTGEKLVQAFSAAAAVFPMAPQASAELFLSSGFLQSFVSLINKWKAQRVEQAGLHLLNAACMDTKCRDAIRKYCPEWLEKVSVYKAGHDQRRMSQATMASLVLEKIKDAKPEGRPSTDDAVEDLSAQEYRISRFKSIIIDRNGDANSKSIALEALAYVSINASGKEALCNDGVFMKSLIALMDDQNSSSASLFGGLTVMANLTAYRPVLSEEQKKLTELKAYANTTKPSALDPLDDNDKVSARCTRVLNVGLVPLITKHSKSLTPTTVLLALQILNSLSTEKSHRGQLAQQGALKFLIQTYDRLTSSTTTQDQSRAAAYTAAHAMARILITVNPSHAFTASSLSLTSAIRPLTYLLNPDKDETADPLSPSTPHTLLPTFESLLALTNLASTDAATCAVIIRASWTALEDLLLSQNTLVQRAAVELVCNLCSSPQGAAQFTGKQAATRLQILLALADAEDMPTRRAAAGALAMLSEWDEVVRGVLANGRGAERLVALMEDESEEVVIRGVVTVRNAVCMEGHVGKLAAAAIGKVTDFNERLEKVFSGGDDQVKETIGEIAAALGKG